MIAGKGGEMDPNSAEFIIFTVVFWLVMVFAAGYTIKRVNTKIQKNKDARMKAVQDKIDSAA